jgi:hypothetical protein
MGLPFNERGKMVREREIMDRRIRTSIPGTETRWHVKQPPRYLSLEFRTEY